MKRELTLPATHPLYSIKTRRPYLAEEGVRTIAVLERYIELQLNKGLWPNQETVLQSLCEEYAGVQNVDFKPTNFPFLKKWLKTNGAEAAEVCELENIYFSTFLESHPCKTNDWFYEYATGKGWRGQALMQQLIYVEAQRHRGLIHQRAQKQARRTGMPSVETLIGVGWQGVLAALKKYDPTEFAFSTYAATRIDGAMRDMLRDEGALPKKISTWAQDINTAEELLVHRNQQMPTLREIAEYLGRDFQEVIKAQAMSDTCAFNLIYENGVGGSISPDYTEQEHSTEVLKQALSLLGSEEQQVVVGVVLEDLTPRAVGSRLGISTSKVLELKESGLGKLQEFFKDSAPALAS